MGATAAATAKCKALCHCTVNAVKSIVKRQNGIFMRPAPSFFLALRPSGVVRSVHLSAGTGVAVAGGRRYRRLFRGAHGEPLHPAIGFPLKGHVSWMPTVGAHKRTCHWAARLCERQYRPTFRRGWGERARRTTAVSCEQADSNDEYGGFTESSEEMRGWSSRPTGEPSCAIYTSEVASASSRPKRRST